MKLYLSLLLFVLMPNRAIAGGGLSGGNPMAPRATIQSVSEGFMFSSPYPTAIDDSGPTKKYTFSLSGYDLTVAKIHYSKGDCPIQAGAKTTCRKVSTNGIIGYIVFANQNTFKVAISTSVLASRALQDIFDQVTLTFVDTK